MEKIIGWLFRRFLNIAGRTTLVNTSLSSLPLFMISFYGLPKGIKKKDDKARARFLWSGKKDKQKYHLLAWPTVCLPKDLGGFGVLDLELMNVALFSKWIWKLFNEHGLWQNFCGTSMLMEQLWGRCN